MKDMHKEYEIPEEQSCIVSEPVFVAPVEAVQQKVPTYEFAINSLDEDGWPTLTCEALPSSLDEVNAAIHQAEDDYQNHRYADSHLAMAELRAHLYSNDMKSFTRS